MIKYRKLGTNAIGGFGWRTDVPAHVYAKDRTITEVHWSTDTGGIIIVPVTALRRALKDAPTRNDEGKTILFNIDPLQRTIKPDGKTPAVHLPEMQVIPNERDDEPKLRCWSGPESEWHSSTVQAIGKDPSLVLSRSTVVLDRWIDKLASEKESAWLWNNLRTRKRPDVVFRLRPEELVVIEVEPYASLLDGIGQLLGDYLINLRLDRSYPLDSCKVRGILVLDSHRVDVDAEYGKELKKHHVQLVEIIETAKT